MSDKLVVHKNRTNVITINMGVDVSLDVITSEIRTKAGALIATWVVTFDTNGTDGLLILTLDNSITSAIEYSSGLMDLKRMVGSEPVPVFDSPLEVEFRETITL